MDGSSLQNGKIECLIISKICTIYMEKIFGNNSLVLVLGFMGLMSMIKWYLLQWLSTMETSQKPPGFLNTLLNISFLQLIIQSHI